MDCGRADVAVSSEMMEGVEALTGELWLLAPKGGSGTAVRLGKACCLRVPAGGVGDGDLGVVPRVTVVNAECLCVRRGPVSTGEEVPSRVVGRACVDRRRTLDDELGFLRYDDLRLVGSRTESCFASPNPSEE
ncbi:hypothetical protein LTR16_012529, partial [Cryomyces antarcticus]